jgi:hypothetical protein
MEFHRFSLLFPELKASELNQLAEDIKANGLIEPITLYEGKVLEGRNRWLACEIAGVEPKTVPYDGYDALGFVISRNLRRRHLDTSQRAMIAADITNLRRGDVQSQRSANLQTVTVQEAADLMNVSPRSVATANTITDAEDKAAVKTGKMSVHAAAKKEKAVRSKPPAKRSPAKTKEETRAWNETKKNFEAELAMTKDRLKGFIALFQPLSHPDDPGERLYIEVYLSDTKYSEDVDEIFDLLVNLRSIKNEFECDRRSS